MSATPPDLPSAPDVAATVRKLNLQNLKLLAVFHFVLAALGLLGIGFLFLHHYMLNTIFSNPEMWKNSKQGPLPAEFFEVFQIFYLVMGVMIVVFMVINVLSGWFIHRHQNRMFSLIIGGINCVIFPFGTVLGIFTFILLLRDSVQELYTSDSKDEITTNHKA